MKEFLAKRSSTLYCSNYCKGKVTGYQSGYMPLNKGLKSFVIKNCKYCGEEFRPKEKRIVFCSKSCAGRYTGYKKGAIPYNIGMQVSEERKQKQRNSMLGRFDKEKHPQWKGGCGKRPTGDIQYKEWRKSVFSRDNFCCQLCGKHDRTLAAHHPLYYQFYPELMLDISNSTTLCNKCHKLIHSKIIWLFGNSTAGKTTFAKYLINRFKKTNIIHLDGDVVRSLWPGLGFSKEDRIENNINIAILAKFFKKLKKEVIISVICPYIGLRNRIRKIINCNFVYIAGGEEPSETFQFEPPIEEERIRTIVYPQKDSNSWTIEHKS
jgi:hypothetical protein